MINRHMKIHGNVTNHQESKNASEKVVEVEQMSMKPVVEQLVDQQPKQQPMLPTMAQTQPPVDMLMANPFMAALIAQQQQQPLQPQLDNPLWLSTLFSLHAQLQQNRPFVFEPSTLAAQTTINLSPNGRRPATLTPPISPPELLLAKQRDSSVFVFP